MNLNHVNREALEKIRILEEEKQELIKKCIPLKHSVRDIERKIHQINLETSHIDSEEIKHECQNIYCRQLFTQASLRIYSLKEMGECFMSKFCSPKCYLSNKAEVNCPIIIDNKIFES